MGGWECSCCGASAMEGQAIWPHPVQHIVDSNYSSHLTQPARAHKEAGKWPPQQTRWRRAHHRPRYAVATA